MQFSSPISIISISIIVAESTKVNKSLLFLEASLLSAKKKYVYLAYLMKNEVFLPSEVFGLFGLIGLRKTSLEDLADFANLGSFVEVPLLSTNGTIECGAPSSSEFGVQLMAWRCATTSFSRRSSVGLDDDGVCSNVPSACSRGEIVRRPLLFCYCCSFVSSDVYCIRRRCGGGM